MDDKWPLPDEAQAIMREEAQQSAAWYRARYDRMPYNEPRTPGDIDPVNHPPHYTAGAIECINAIQAALTPEEFRGYCKGNAIKYAWRERHKGQNESLSKAIWYLNRATQGA